MDTKLMRIFKFLFWVLAGVNLIGALGPEISFDALWYHLPIARLAAERGWWGIVPGGLLYTSAVPRLVDFANAILLMIADWLRLDSPEVLPKLLSYAVGIGSAGMIYKIARRYVEPVYAWGGVLLWYSNLVVGWQSIVVYNDLHRTFLTLVAIWYTLESMEKDKLKNAAKAGVFWGLAYSAKILAGIDLVFLSAVLIFRNRQRLGGLVLMVTVAGLIAATWGVGNMLQGYNFFYPFYGQTIYMPTGFNLVTSHVWSPLWQFFHPQLRTGPLVLIPLLLAGKSIWKKMPEGLIMIGLALFASWWFAPAIVTKGDGRYFLPTLAVMGVMTSYILAKLEGNKQKIVVGVIIISAIFGISYRAAANSKFVPYLLGEETKAQFLARKLNFDYGDWYDTDGWVLKNLADKKYMVVGVHNTYYLPGKDWDHESWMKESVCYPYALVQGDSLVKREWTIIHEVEETRTRIYETNCL